MTRLFPLIFLTLALSGCHGILDGIYDDAPSDSSFKEGFQKAETGANRHVLMLDATSYDEWIYVDLHDMAIERISTPTSLTSEKWDGKSGITYNLVHGDQYTELSITPTDPMPEPAKWDFAVHHFDVKTNGGSAAVAPSQNLSLASKSQASTLDFVADKWSTHQAIIDLKEMMGFKIGYQNSHYSPILSDWASMDFSTPPPTYSASGDVYYLRMADGSMAALQLRSYMSPLGSKGYLTIDIIYPL